MIEKEGFVCGTSMLGTKEEQGMVAAVYKRPIVRTEHSPRGVRSEGASCLAMKSAERMPNDTLRIEAK